MSQFITNTKSIENQPIFSLQAKEVVMPRIKKYIKLGPQDQIKNYRKQSKLLYNICQRLQRQEFQVIHNENVKQMQKKFQILKRKMTNNMQKQSVQKIFSSAVDADKLNIRQILKMRPQRIQLQKKYGNKIILKMQNYRQAEQISKMKEKYHNWYNSQKNDTCNSPVFKKMTYLLQRANKQNIFTDLKTVKCAGIRHTTKNKNQTILNTSFQKYVNRNTSPYQKRHLNWANKRPKFSLLDNFEV